MSGIPGNPNLQSAGKATQFQPGQSGNPNGRPKGSKNWSTVVQDLLFDDDFVGKVEGLMSKKNPIWEKLPNKNFANIIVSSMMLKASGGDKQAAEWLRKTGFGDKIDLTTDGESLNTTGNASQENAALFASFLSTQVKDSVPKNKPNIDNSGVTNLQHLTEPKPTGATNLQQPTIANTPQPAVQPQVENARPLSTPQQPIQNAGSSSVPSNPAPVNPATHITPQITPQRPIEPTNQAPATAVPATPAPSQPLGNGNSAGSAEAVPAQGQPINATV